MGRARIIHETPVPINYNARFYQRIPLDFMRTDDFDFILPEHLIAQHPPAQRGASRLLRVGKAGPTDSQFADLHGLVREHDVLVLNDTRVINARLFGEKESGGKVEVLVERVLDEHDVLAQVRVSKTPKPGSRLLLAEKLRVQVLGREGEFFHLRFEDAEAVTTLLERHGHLPLPPYITHAAGAEDETRYQTVFAREPGAVAAPTAGLHFGETMLQALGDKGVNIAYVTLHVGAGTFKPVRAENVEEHVMHSERYDHPAGHGGCHCSGQGQRRACHRGGNDQFARLGKCGSKWGTDRRIKRNQHLHNPRLPLQDGGSVADQFPPAAFHPVDAGVRFRRNG